MEAAAPAGVSDCSAGRLTLLAGCDDQQAIWLCGRFQPVPA